MIPFGTTKDGQTVHAVTLSDADLSVRILTYGAILQDLRLAGVDHSLTIGSDDFARYEADLQYHGPLIGPVVNRLSGARAPIGGVMYQFEANQDGKHTLHSGSASTAIKIWQVTDQGPAHVEMALDLPDGEGGFPGTRRVSVRFGITAPATLTMVVTGTTDAPTLMNFANHSYWNLDGSGTYDGHALQVHADRWLPTTADFTPSGVIEQAQDSHLDFRQMRPVQAKTPPLDNNFCLSPGAKIPREALVLRGPSGLEMTVATTAPGIQVFDNRPNYQGLAIEAQGWPDAPNHPDFDSIELHPGDTYHQHTEWRFSRKT